MKINYAFVMFIGIFLTLYGLLHFYFYRKVTKAFGLSLTQNIIFIIVLCLLMLCPIIMRVMEDRGPETLSTVVTYIGYLWMGIIFLLFVFNLTVDLYRLLIYISSRIFNPSLIKLIPDKRITLLVILSVILFINFYGMYEAWNIKTEKITLKTDKLPEGINNLRIVQISDIHFSRLNGVRLANKITDIILGLDPDLLVSTGDLIDDGLRQPDKVQALFSNIKPKYGKYATTGNHEFITGIVKSTRFTEKCGFKLLRNEYAEVNRFIELGAVDDPAAYRNGAGKKIDEKEVVDCFTPGKIDIFLKHQPRIEKNSVGKFDIQLSGHTHNGQIFPFNLIVGMMYKYMHGMFYLGNGSYLYVSRGTGTWGPPVRFLSPPEITVIDFIKKDPGNNKVRERINE